MFKTLKKTLGLKKNEGESDGNQFSAAKMQQNSSKSGYLQKCGGSVKSWKKRLFILVGTTLFYYKDEQSSEPQGYLKIEDGKSIERADKETGRDYSFKVSYQERVYYIAAESDYGAESWIHELKLACNKSVNYMENAKMVGWILRKASRSDTIFKDRFIAVSKGYLHIYRDPTDETPKKSYPLVGATVRFVDEIYQRPSIQISIADKHTGKVQKSIVIASDYEDIPIWKAVLEAEAEAGVEVLDKAKFKGWLFIDTSGKLKKWEFKYFVIQESKLLIFDDDKSEIEAGSIELIGRLITRCDNEELFSFKIASFDENIYLKAQEDDEVDFWVEMLKKVTKENSIQDTKKSGWLTKQGGSVKTWKKRFCVLKETQLYYYANPTDSEPKGSIQLAGMCIRHLTPAEAEDEVGSEHVIKIFTPNRTYYIYGDTLQDIFEWTVVMRRAALEMDGKTWIVDQGATSKDKKDGKFSTIQEAISKAKDMDRILIYPGSYSESLFIKKALIFSGVGDVKIETRTTTPIHFKTSACKFENITINQLGATTEKNAIDIEKGNVMLLHCEVTSAGGNCINVADESQLTLNNCKVTQGKQYGIFLSSRSSVLLEDNIISDNGWDGIMMMLDSDAIIRSSRIYNNKYNGVAVSSSGRVTIEHCDIMSNSWDGISVSNMKSRCNLHDNKIFGNGGYGLYFSKQPDEKVNAVDNDVFDNVKGQIHAS